MLSVRNEGEHHLSIEAVEQKMVSGVGGVGEEELSGDDASLAGSDGMSRERELDERALEDEMIDDDSGRPSEPVDDAQQAEYVNSLTLPRAALLPTSQEPGMVDWIGRIYRMYTR